MKYVSFPWFPVVASVSNFKTVRINGTNTVVLPYPLIQYPRITAARKEIGTLNKRSIRFKTRAKRERAVT
jgi:hypothetical protein